MAREKSLVSMSHLDLSRLVTFRDTCFKVMTTKTDQVVLSKKTTWPIKQPKNFRNPLKL